MAQGIPHTHAAKATLVLDRLAEWTRVSTGDDRLANQVRAANTARQAFNLLTPLNRSVIQAVGARIVEAATAFAGGRLRVRSIIFDYNGEVVSDSATRQRQDRYDGN
jgi:cobalt-precorrin-5B (C1)-methyltransferase